MPDIVHARRHMPDIVHGIYAPVRSDEGPEFVWYDLSYGAPARLRACAADGVHGGHERDWCESLDVKIVDEPLQFRKVPSRSYGVRAIGSCCWFPCNSYSQSNLNLNPICSPSLKFTE